MSRFFKRFGTRKKKSPLSAEDTSDSSTEIKHGFVDNVGGINFPTSPTTENLSTARKFSEPSELTIFWSQPRYGRHTQRVNPIFINEPTELYEAAFIPPDNAHDYSVLPRYRVNDSRSMYGLDMITDDPSHAADASSMHRSCSVGALPSFNYENEGLNLTDLKNKRREENASGRGRLFGLFDNQDEHSTTQNKLHQRDSGVFPTFDDDDDDVNDGPAHRNCLNDRTDGDDVDEEPIEQLLSRKFNEFHPDESSVATRLDISRSQESPSDFAIDFEFDKTIRESSLMISALESVGASKQAREEWTDPNNFKTFNRPKSEKLHENFDTSIQTTVGPSGQFSRSKSVPDVNETFRSDTLNSTTASELDFSSMEETLEDLEHHLANGSKTQTFDPLALRERELFNNHSPTLGAVPRGRVSSIKQQLESSKERSKSVSHLSRKDQDESDARDTTKQTNRMKSSASFGNIDINSLSPLLNDRKFFGKTILNDNINAGEEDECMNDEPVFTDSTVGIGGARSRIPNTRPITISTRTQSNDNVRLTKEVRCVSIATSLPTSGRDSNIEVKEELMQINTQDFNRQLPLFSPDIYMHAEGDHNTMTGAGITILETRSQSTQPKQSNVQTLLTAIERSELPEFVEEGVYPDRACKRTIMQLIVRCYNFGKECEWTGELSNLQEHLDLCDKIPVTCVNSCGRTDIPRNEMNQHVDVDGDCPLAVVFCRYHDVGCKHKARRADMEMHLHESLEQHLDLAHAKIHELEVRDNVCSNGKFLWKISSYEHLVKQSATKKDKEKLCSPPFYTGQYGYKLRAEAFLNGLGQGKGSHLSLYVVIMKGEYDAILPWPFKQNVDFVLIDQDDDKSNRQNKVWKLSCERNSDYFQRPNKAKSLGFGCPKFVSLDTLKTRNYIKDQTLFIKIEVEPTDHLIFAPVASSSSK